MTVRPLTQTRLLPLYPSKKRKKLRERRKKFTYLLANPTIKVGQVVKAACLPYAEKCCILFALRKKNNGKVWHFAM
jgi:hypothetical protein